MKKSIKKLCIVSITLAALLLYGCSNKEAANTNTNEPKTEPCVHCEGTGIHNGYSACETCQGIGFVSGPTDCSTCFNGKVVCPDCKGDHNNACSGCNNTGSVNCTDCSGTGSADGNVKCTDCDGARYLLNAACHACDGSGHATGKPYEEAPLQCGLCTGSGVSAGYARCRSCGGDRKITCPTCDGDRYATCPQCNGDTSVDCDNCTRGKVRCETCNRTGKADCTTCNVNGESWYEDIPCVNCGGSGKATILVDCTCDYGFVGYDNYGYNTCDICGGKGSVFTVIGE